MAHVVIFGGSRGIGLETVKQALAAGHRVRAVARSADRIPISDDALEKRQASALDRTDAAAAVFGTDVVIQTLGVAFGPGFVLKGTTLFSQATDVLIHAMGTAGVKRLVCVTGFGAGDSHGHLSPMSRVAFKLVLGRVYDDKTIQEQKIRDSGLDWTIVRPVVLTNGPRTGRYQVLIEPRQWRSGLISRADVADFLVRQIDDDGLVGKTPVISY